MYGCIHTHVYLNANAYIYIYIYIYIYLCVCARAQYIKLGSCRKSSALCELYFFEFHVKDNVVILFSSFIFGLFIYSFYYLTVIDRKLS